FLLFVLLLRLALRSTLFPYTTLFRSLPRLSKWGLNGIEGQASHDMQFAHSINFAANIRIDIPNLWHAGAFVDFAVGPGIILGRNPRGFPPRPWFPISRLGWYSRCPAARPRPAL